MKDHDDGADGDIYKVCTPSGWEFHSLPLGNDDNAVGVRRDEDSADAKATEAEDHPLRRQGARGAATDDGSGRRATLLSEPSIYHVLPDIVRNFDEDGFIALSSLLTPTFARALSEECVEIFYGVLEWLFLNGEADFRSSHMMISEREERCEPNERSKGEPPPRSNEGWGGKATPEPPPSKYRYPIGAGVRNGYRELVMRSPGRYELALLTDVPPPPPSGDMDGNGNSVDTDYDGKWLLSADALRRAGELRGLNLDNAVSAPARNEGSHLRRLLEWIKNYAIPSKETDGNTGEGMYPIDERNVRQFMELVKAIFPPPPGSKCGRGRDGNYYMCNLSLLVATPGCPTQPWHADGGHVNLAAHEPCHVFNAFVPLVDVPCAMGPTEFRPGTHRHTRRLAPMMLAARARGTLRPPAAPELRAGDCVVFDYRILHRGGGNTSDEVNGVAMEPNGCGRRAGDVDVADRRGRSRPILVMTFARGWFIDVCNFPKRSVFAFNDR